MKAEHVRRVERFFSGISVLEVSALARSARGVLFFDPIKGLLWERSPDAPRLVSLALHVAVDDLDGGVELGFADGTTEAIRLVDDVASSHDDGALTTGVLCALTTQPVLAVERTGAEIRDVDAVTTSVKWHATSRIDATHHGVAIMSGEVWLITPASHPSPPCVVLDLRATRPVITSEGQDFALTPQAREAAARAWLMTRARNERPRFRHAVTEGSGVTPRDELEVRVVRTRLGLVGGADEHPTSWRTSATVAAQLRDEIDALDERAVPWRTWAPTIQEWWARTHRDQREHPRTTELLTVSLASLLSRTSDARPIRRLQQALASRDAGAASSASPDVTVELGSRLVVTARQLLLPRTLVEQAVSAEAIDDQSWSHTTLSEHAVAVWFGEPVDLDAGHEVVGTLAVRTEDGVPSRAVWWLVRESGDPTTVTPVLGMLDAAELEGLGSNAIAFAAWASWSPAPEPPDLAALTDPGLTSATTRKVVRSKPFRSALRTGSMVRVYSLSAAQPRFGLPSRETATPPSGRSVAPHLRRAHWRRVRVGPHDAWHYELRFIPGTFVRGAAPRVVVHRIPDSSVRLEPQPHSPVPRVR